jgi:hypothetical protein
MPTCHVLPSDKFKGNNIFSKMLKVFNPTCVWTYTYTNIESNVRSRGRYDYIQNYGTVYIDRNVRFVLVSLHRYYWAF